MDAGLSPDDRTWPCEVGTGSGLIEIRAAGLPAGVEAKVDVVRSSFGGLSRPAAGSHPAGFYEIIPRSVTQGDPVVRTVYEVTTQPRGICLHDDQTVVVELSYTKVGSSNQLWLTHSDPASQLASIPGSVLTSSVTTTATTFDFRRPTRQDASSDAAMSVAFDRLGRAWIASDIGSVRYVTPSELVVGGTKQSRLWFERGVPSALAFDAHGNLFVAIAADKKIHRLVTSHFTKSTGNSVRDVAPRPVSTQGPFLAGVSALAFDVAGNLYAAADDKILRFDATRLHEGESTDPPEMSLTAWTPSLERLTRPSGLAFDQGGNLWVAYSTAKRIVRFAPADLAHTGDSIVTPAIQIAILGSAAIGPLAFDESHGLWLPYSNGAVARLAPAQLAVSGDVTPETIVKVNGLGTANGVAFFPAPAGLPLFSALP